GERTDKGDYNRAVTGINQTTAKIIDLQQARAERDAKRQQQQLEQWQQAERQQCRGLNSQKLRDRANTWRNPEAPPTPEIRKLREQLEQLQRA
ncbi:hypothetical protein, partial [Klebsiella quasipneumoniae]|uniref:hypothetical protein n=1 Tax=Klebsiella quasipneumoniae TaxID=1463165 RepID=UPI0027314EC7